MAPSRPDMDAATKALEPLPEKMGEDDTELSSELLILLLVKIHGPMLIIPRKMRLAKRVYRGIFTEIH